MSGLTYGEAVGDVSTRLGRDAAGLAAERLARLEAAKLVAASQGITLEAALLGLWKRAV